MSTAELSPLPINPNVAHAPSTPSPVITVIEPPRGWLRLNLGEVWRYRDLLFLLIWRDLSARYRQSVVGFGWAFIKPIVSVLTFDVVFGRMAKLESDGFPYPLFALAALIPWTYFSSTLSSVSSSVVGASGMLTKVYFPRLILPLASLGAGLADLAIQLAILAGMMAWFGYAPGWTLLLLPLLVLYTVAVSLAFGLWLTALNVRYRDVGHAVPFVLQTWMWLSPIVYSSSMVPDNWRPLYALNPLVGVIEGFRWCLLGAIPPNAVSFVSSLVMMLVILVGGLIFFRRQEATFADII